MADAEAGEAAGGQPDGGVPDACLYRAHPDAIDCPLGDGLAILHSASGTYFSLNRSGALLWERAREPVSREAMAAALRTAYRDAPETLEADTARLIASLVDAGLLVVVGPATAEA